MTAFVPVYRCGTAPDSHRIPFCFAVVPRKGRRTDSDYIQEVTVYCNTICGVLFCWTVVFSLELLPCPACFPGVKMGEGMSGMCTQCPYIPDVKPRHRTGAVLLAAYFSCTLSKYRVSWRFIHNQIINSPHRAREDTHVTEKRTQLHRCLQRPNREPGENPGRTPPL